MKTATGKKIGTVLMAVLLSAALIPSAADACRGGKGGRGGGSGYGMDCGMKGGRGGGSHFGIWQNSQAVKNLGLSAEQVKQLKEADFATREKELPLRAELDSLRLKMDQAFAAEPVDEKAVVELTEKISAVKGKLAVQRTEAKLAMKKILTPEQLDQMQSMRGGNAPCAMNGQGNGSKPCAMGGKGQGGKMMQP
ncbi:LTXXQ motif family protein [Candidatus Electronema halotolerans]